MRRDERDVLNILLKLNTLLNTTKLIIKSLVFKFAFWSFIVNALLSAFPAGFFETVE
tara:strand:+ start:314 stop:484 length:171 start_codon:yes stop_codon:yes gene_type:complete